MRRHSEQQRWDQHLFALSIMTHHLPVSPLAPVLGKQEGLDQTGTEALMK